MRITAILVAALVVAPAARAQDARPVAISVGPIASAMQCTLYQGVRGQSRTVTAGSSGIAANAYGVAAGSSYAQLHEASWETFFVRDCVKQFQGVRQAIQAALASSGSVIVGGGQYTLSGRVENVAPTGSAYQETGLTGRSYGTANRGMLVTFSVTVKDRAGRIVFGSPVMTEIQTGYGAYTGANAAAGGMSGEGIYGVLQRQLAMATARKVAFHFRPMLVVQNTGRAIQLNYGTPLLEVGTMLTVTSPDGGQAMRYRVSSTSEGSALAQKYGNGDDSRIGPGSRAMVIESGDPAAGEGTMERVELP